MPQSMLETSRITTFRGPVRALTGVSVKATAGECIAVLGPNGAGKTTLLRTIAGLERPAEGSVSIDGTVISRMAPHRVARQGVSLVLEHRGLFGELTVEQNVMVGSAGVRPWRPGEMRAARDRVEAMFDQFPLLQPLRTRRAEELSGGEAQLVAIVRGLVAQPRVLLLDEPTTGLAPVILVALTEFIQQVVATGITVVVTEQNVRFALGLASRVYLLSRGEAVFEGDREKFISEIDAFSAFLGDYGTSQLEV